VFVDRVLLIRAIFYKDSCLKNRVQVSVAPSVIKITAEESYASDVGSTFFY
jgi:hypothetical protein